MKRGLRRPAAICEMPNPAGRATACPDGEPSTRPSGMGDSGAVLAAAFAVATLSATNCRPVTSFDCAATPAVLTSSGSPARAISRRHTVLRITLIGADLDDAVATR